MNCEGCLYWRNLDNRVLSPAKCCHYALDNYARRPRAEDGSCLGYTPKGELRQRKINKNWNAPRGDKKGESK